MIRRPPRSTLFPYARSSDLYHYQWYRGVSAIANATSSTLDLSVGGNGDRGDVIKVVVYATDGPNGGTSGNAENTVTIVNSSPRASTAALTPASPTTNQTLTA